MELRESDIARFWSKLVVGGPDECWLWQAPPDKCGYGRIQLRNEGYRLAHRVSWIIHNGQIPDGQQVLHKCDVRNCVNPNHLFLGDNTANVKDKMQKGRWAGAVGSKHPHSKLTERDIVGIHKLRRAGMTQGAIGDVFGVSQFAISHILLGKGWKHVERG